jgi:hypothetical protein
VSEPLPKHVPVRLENREYKVLRQRVMQRDSWRCQFCGSMTNLEVHHQRFRSHSGEDKERLPRTALSGIEKKSVLPDVDPRAPAARGKTRTQAGGLVKRPGTRETGAVPERSGFKSANWLHKAKTMSHQEFQREVEKELTGQDSEPHELMVL